MHTRGFIWLPQKINMLVKSSIKWVKLAFQIVTVSPFIISIKNHYEMRFWWPILYRHSCMVRVNFGSLRECENIIRSLNARLFWVASIILEIMLNNLIMFNNLMGAQSPLVSRVCHRWSSDGIPKNRPRENWVEFFEHKGNTKPHCIGGSFLLFHSFFA